MKIRAKNPALKSLIIELMEKGEKEKVPLWTAIAKALNKPRKNQAKVNIYKIEKYAEKGQTIVVPGTVLGQGILTKPVKVFALKFSASARKAILSVKGSCMDISEITKIERKGVKIMR